MSIEQLVAGCPECGSKEYTFTRVSEQVCRLSCLMCAKQWEVENPFQDEKEKLVPSEQKGVYVVQIYRMAFAVKDIIEAQKIATYAAKIGYPEHSVSISYCPILNAVTVNEELDWINAEAIAHETSDKSCVEEG